MNYLEAEPSRYKLRTHNSLFKYESFKECPPLKGAMGDELYCIGAKK